MTPLFVYMFVCVYYRLYSSSCLLHSAIVTMCIIVFFLLYCTNYHSFFLSLCSLFYYISYYIINILLIGNLDRGELQCAVSDIMGHEIDTNHIEIILQEFDKDGNGEIDFSEFRTIAKYLQKEDVRRRSVSSTVLHCTVV